MAKRHMRANERGFTLIELMISVVIVGILGAIAVPSYATAQDRAKNAAVQANCHAVQMAVEQYGVDTAGIYPVDAERLFSKVIEDEAYMGSKGFRATPWDTRQAKGIVWPAASESVRYGTEIGPGVTVDPVRPTHYGGIAYTLAKGVTANERYILVGVGKLAGKAVVVSALRNF